MNRIDDINELINRDPKYSIFRNNDFINKYKLEFKDKNFKSIGFKYDGILTPETTLNALCSIFNIQNKESFEESFKEVISGDGKELINMLTLHSSSLCALLHFFNVNEHPITITIDGDNYKFDEVHFEIKNTVFTRPSNMDVVLIAHNNPAILFLESKFSEYLKNSDESVSVRYLRERDFIDTLDWIERNVSKKDHVYIGGLKQFLAHYIGISHFVNDIEYSYHANEPSKRRVHDFYNTNNPKIFLQEIIFNLDDKKCDAYKCHLSKMIDNIHKYRDEPKITVLNPITYQEFFEHANVNSVLCKNVKEFYKY